MNLTNCQFTGHRFFPRSRFNTALVMITLIQVLISTPDLFAANKSTAVELLLTDESVSLWKIMPEAVSAEPVWEKTDLVTSLAALTQQDQVFIGSSNGLYALNRRDGSVDWQFRGKDLIYSPIVENAIAYAASRDGMLRAINSDDGSLVWKRAFPGWIYTPALSSGILVTGGSASQ